MPATKLKQICDEIDKLVILKSQQQWAISLRGDNDDVLDSIKDLSHKIRVLRRRRDALKKKI